MSRYRGYKGESLKFLKKYDVIVGDSVEIASDATYTGIIMPRYEDSDDKHIVLKLESGYNVGLEIKKIYNVKKIQAEKKSHEKQTMIHKEGLPKILLLSTGGTIASKIDYRTGAVTPVLTAEELSSSVPELADIANIDTKAILSEYSENITTAHWLVIAQEIIKYEKSNYAGIIVAHGTDTMHYTSAFLSFALAGFSMPIVLVGSQRSSDRASSDAALNLIGAARFITKCDVNRVYIAMHQNENDGIIACHLGTRVRKNHTSKRGAFQTIGGEPAFIITEKGIQKNKDFESRKFDPKIKLDTKVALVKYHPGIDPNIIDEIIRMNYKGIIFEGTGLGHIGKTTYESVKRANEHGLFLGMTSQCIDGRISMTVYESGRDLLNLGVIPLNMIPEVALVKAMWAFGNFERNEIKKIMLKDIASEMNN